MAVATFADLRRAWTLIGFAIRFAVALGLNMRNESANLKDGLKEIRYRLWWALYTLEHRLCAITGRINCVLDDHYTTPLPVPVDEDKFETEEGQRFLSTESQQRERAPTSNSHSPSVSSPRNSYERSQSGGKSEQSRSPSTLQVRQVDLEWAKDVQPCSSLYFLHLVQLTRLTQNVVDHLYNPTSVEGTWSSIQTQIGKLSEQLDGWYRKLPVIFDFRRKQRDRDYYEFRLNLGFAYYATKQMIHRPCLCRIDRKLPNQSSKSREFSRASATSCVEAARDTLRLIPDEPNAVGLISVGPWWSILPYLVQSASVLMLEISFRAHHMPEEADAILVSSKKALGWLHALAEENLSARRAWQLCNTMLRQAVVKIGRNVDDLPDRPPGRGSASSTDGIDSIPEAGADQMQSFSDMSVDMYGTQVSGTMYPGFSALDQMMHYDQYYPSAMSMNAASQNVHYNTGAASDAELEFMTNAYLDDRADSNQRTNHTSGGRSGM